MLNTSKRVRALITLAGMAAAMFATQLALPGTAQARCAGQNNEHSDVLKFGGDVYVTERPITGTCNGNTLYRGEFQLNKAGWQPVVYLQSSGNWSAHFGSTVVGAWTPLELDDINSHSLILLCVTDGSQWICGDESNAVSGANPVYTYHEDNDGY